MAARCGQRASQVGTILLPDVILDPMLRAHPTAPASQDGPIADARASSATVRVACPSCDLLYDVGALQDHETARCSRCNHFLTTYKADELDRVLCYSISGLIALVVSCLFPFMQFSRSGLESTMTLPQTALALWQNGMPEMSIMVGAFIILIPAAVLLLLVILTWTLKRGIPAPWLKDVARLIFHSQNWAMVEVFFVGVLVSLVKIAKMATIVLGLSFWAYAAFCVLFILAITNLDRVQTWQRIEYLCQ